MTTTRSDDVTEVLRQDPPVGELRVVWLLPLDTLPRYVRERIEELPNRTGLTERQRYQGTRRIVGYSELHPDAPSIASRPGFYRRRIFYVLSHDHYPGDDVPCDAVDPRLVKAGLASAYFHGDT